MSPRWTLARRLAVSSLLMGLSFLVMSLLFAITVAYLNGDLPFFSGTVRDSSGTVRDSSGTLPDLNGAVGHLSGQDSGESQGTPTAVARHLFDALKRRDIATFVSLFHPDEIKRLKAFAIDVFNVDKPSELVQNLRKLFAPFDKPESVAAASGSDLFAAFLRNTYAAIPEFSELMADVTQEILGEVAEGPDKVHVITRTILPRPQPISCRKDGGRWYSLLNDEATRMITAFAQLQHFRLKNPEDIKNLGARTKMDEIVVIGHVKDGKDVAQVLCRSKAKIDDFSFSVFGCYPVRKGEPAWNHLDDKDKTQLVDAIRAKWAAVDRQLFN